MPFQFVGEDQQQLCTFDFLWHDKYKRTLELLEEKQATIEFDDVESSGIHSRLVVPGSKRNEANPDVRTIEVPRQRTADPCARLLLVLILLVNVVIALAIAGK
jgi:hypothetical protein